MKGKIKQMEEMERRAAIEQMEAMRKMQIEANIGLLLAVLGTISKMGSIRYGEKR